MTFSASDVVFRDMQWWDIDDVLVIEQTLFEHDPWTPEMFWAELAQVPESRNVWVAVNLGVIVGYGSLRVVGNEGDINTIAISPSMQRQGFGQKLYGVMEQTARDRGVRNLFLEVRSDNEPAQDLYRKTGFEQIEVRKGYYGTTIDALVMRKRLSDD